MKKIAAILTSWGAPGLFLLAILDSAGVPLPAAVDALLVATAIINPAAAYLSALFAVIGSALGSLFLFYLAQKGGQTYLNRVTATEGGAKFRHWFQTYGLITVFVPALLPIPLPLKVFVVSAGALGVSPVKYMIVVLAARIPRYFGLAWLGTQLGHETMPWIKSHVWHLLLFALLLALTLYYAVKRVSRESPSH
ncbi:MAG: VTT domain-containing protein [Bryobacteraceae bacterium]